MSNIIIDGEPYYFDHMLYPTTKAIFQPVVDTIHVNYFLFYLYLLKYQIII
jgi:hypothetical protein